MPQDAVVMSWTAYDNDGALSEAQKPWLTKVAVMDRGYTTFYDEVAPLDEKDYSPSQLSVAVVIRGE